MILCAGSTRSQMVEWRLKKKNGNLEVFWTAHRRLFSLQRVFIFFYFFLGESFSRVLISLCCCCLDSMLWVWSSPSISSSCLLGCSSFSFLFSASNDDTETEIPNSQPVIQCVCLLALRSCNSKKSATKHMWSDESQTDESDWVNEAWELRFEGD